MGAKSWLVTVTVCFVMAVGTATGFANDPDGRYMQVCRDDIEKNNPGWTGEQKTEICNCKLRYFHAEQSNETLAQYVWAFEVGELSRISDQVIQADLRYFGICSKDSSAQP